jgi:8-oxo-dGTP diphosphatase
MIFREPPVDFKKQLDVVGCYVMHDDRFLMLHRHAHKSDGDRWGLPAGKRDGEEPLAEAMRRELREETGIDILESDLHFFDSVAVRHAGPDIEYHMFSVEMPEQPGIRLSEGEHRDFRWVTPEEALSMLLVHDQDECIRLFFADRSLL